MKYFLDIISKLHKLSVYTIKTVIIFIILGGSASLLTTSTLKFLLIIGGVSIVVWILTPSNKEILNERRD